MEPKDIRYLYAERRATKDRREDILRRAQQAFDEACRDLEAVERTAELLHIDLLDQAEGPPRAGQASLFDRSGEKPSVTALAIGVLREAGHPLHVTEIVSRLEKLGRPVKKMTLVSALAKLAKTHETIIRTSQPNTFTLVESRENGHAVTGNTDDGHRRGHQGQEGIAGPTVALLNESSHRTFRAEDVMVAIGAKNLNSVRSALQRLEAAKRIRRAGWGKYQSIGGRSEVH